MLSIETKRVELLYRVSSIGQVEKDDIPMQRLFCREFVAGHSNWVIVKELYEKGVSGFKKSAKERDAIQELQQDAVEGKFDILLVYMFDRLGRKDDETPFVVEWFVKNGIEVWSAVEGEQRFDNHVDKLLNYIRYWQASGESIKTSMRVKTRLEQLTESGLYTGGTLPYGYRLENKGRTNKRNKEVGDLVIDETAAEIVRLIFHKYVNEGYGAQRISRYLMEMNIRREDGSDFPNTTLVRMLKNRIYTGVIHNGDVESEPIPELQIIDPDTFERAQALMKDRTINRTGASANLRGRSLLVGNIYCGHCGNRLTLTTSGRIINRADGTIRNGVKLRYNCHYKARHPDKCDGPSGYGVTKLDGIVDQIIRYQLSKIQANSSSQAIIKQHEQSIALAKARYRLTCSQLSEKQKELTDLQAETIKVIRGESRLSIDLLNELVAKAQEEIHRLTLSSEEARSSLEEVQHSAAQEEQEMNQLKTWADLYDNCTFAAKKMIVSQFIKSIHVYRDYTLEIMFNVTFDEFRKLSADTRNLGNEKAEIYARAE